jgi:photosystem II stability/assembly factor-like uncharacterized protein
MPTGVLPNFSRVSFLTFVALALIFAYDVPARSQLTWSPSSGPYGGEIASFGTHAGTILAACNPGGVFRSTNVGLVWMESGANITSREITSVVSNLNGDFFLTTVYGGAYRSNDGGQTWAQMGAGILDGDLRRVVVLGNDTVFVGSDHGVFRSLDRGQSWERANVGLADTNITALAITLDGSVFAGTPNALFRSLDLGATWTSVSAGITSPNINAVHVLSPGIIIVAANYDGIYRSTNNGNSWTQVATSIDVRSFAKRFGSPLFAGTSNEGVLASTDGGTTWNVASAAFRYTVVSSLIIHEGGALFAGLVGGGVHRSTDDGVSWAEANSGISATLVTSVAVKTPSLMFAGTSGDGLFRSTDGGIGWAHANAGLTNLYIGTIAVNSGGMLFAGTYGGGVYRSADDGNNWAQVNNGLSNLFVHSLLMLPSGDILAGTGGGAVFRTSNNGDLWESRSSGIPSFDVLSLSVDAAGALLAATDGGGLYRSTNGGGSWNGTNVGLNDPYLRVIKSGTGNAIFVGATDGVYRSTDGAASWTQINAGLSGLTVNAIANSGVELFAGAEDGVFRSTDNGDNWINVSEGLRVPTVWSLEVNPYGFLFAGTRGGGIFFRGLASPPSPVLVAPANSATNQPTSGMLRWMRSLNAVWYHVQLSTDPTFQAVLAVNDTAVADTFKSISGLANNTAYYWRVRARNLSSAGSFSSSFSFQTIATTTISTPGPIVFPPEPTSSTDYRLFGLPGVGTVAVGSILSGAQQTDWRMYRDNGAPTSYLEELSANSNLSGGEGYWLIKKGNLTISRAATMPALNPDGTYSINLHTGWNIITNPFNRDVAWSTVRAANGLSPTADLIDYQGAAGYNHSAAVLEPFKGYYYFNAPGSTSLKIPYLLGSSALQSAPPSVRWKLRLTYQSDINIDEDNWIGISSWADEGLDFMDARKPPLVFDQAFVYFDRRAWDSIYSRFSADIRPAVGEGQVWEFDVSNPRKSHGTLRFEGIDLIPDEFKVVLVNKFNTAPYDLRRSNEYTFQSLSEKTRFKLIVGKPGYVNSALSRERPTAFELDQNFPNPFNPSTAITFRLPKESYVVLEVLTLLGQRIKTLAEGRFVPAVHTVEWDGTNELGQRVASGIYFCRLMVDGAAMQTRKMILAK